MSGLLQTIQVPVRGSPSTTAPPALSTRWLSKDQEVEWDAFVTQHTLGSVYYLTDWKKVIEDAFPHIRGRFLVQRENKSGRIVAGLPVYEVKSWLLGNRLVSVPFATTCDPLVSTFEEWQNFVPEIQKQCIQTRSKKLEIRGTVIGGQYPPPFTSSSHFRHHILPLGSDFDELIKTFDKQSVRQKAEKARKAGVSIEERVDKEAIGICNSLLAATRRRLSLPPMPCRFFESMQEHLYPGHLKIFLALKEGEPIACHLVLHFKDRWISEYSGNADGAISGVNQLLYLETIRRACSEGARLFSFGRTSITSGGLLAYKRRWRATEEELTDYVLVNDRNRESPDTDWVPKLQDSKMFKVFNTILAKSPLSVRTMVGNFCYRHLG
jgi:hypothetical protein